MNNLEWFTGNEMSAKEVAAMTVEEIEAGVLEIGIDENQDASVLAQEIKKLAEAEL